MVYLLLVNDVSQSVQKPSPLSVKNSFAACRSLGHIQFGLDIPHSAAFITGDDEQGVEGRDADVIPRRFFSAITET